MIALSVVGYTDDTLSQINLTVGEEAELVISYNSHNSNNETVLFDNSSVAFNITPSLPAGLTLSSHGVISGSPDVVTEAADYTIEAENEQGRRGELTLTLAVIPAPPPSTLRYNASKITAYLGMSLDPVSVTASGVKLLPNMTFATKENLPVGLVVDRETGAISGKPKFLVTKAAYTITATSAGGSKDVLVTIEVVEEPPRNLKITTGRPRQQVGGMDLYLFSIGTRVDFVPTWEGGAAVSFSINPDLPTPLVLVRQDGRIEGIPDKDMARTIYVLTAVNSGGITRTLPFYLDITAPYPVVVYPWRNMFTLTFPITPVVPSVSKDGGEVFEFAVHGDPLPLGITLNTTTGVMSGTALKASGSHEYTIEARGEAGSVYVNLTISISAVPPPVLSVKLVHTRTHNTHAHTHNNKHTHKHLQTHTFAHTHIHTLQNRSLLLPSCWY